MSSHLPESLYPHRVTNQDIRSIDDVLLAVRGEKL